MRLPRERKRCGCPGTEIDVVARDRNRCGCPWIVTMLIPEIIKTQVKHTSAWTAIPYGVSARDGGHM